MIEALIEAERECTERVDVCPEKVLRPIGFVFKDWCESLSSTKPPHWIYWKIDEHCTTFQGRHGDKLLYERCESLISISEEEYEEYTA